MIAASAAAAGLMWALWLLPGAARAGVPWPVWACALLAGNCALTLTSRRCKHGLAHALQKYLLNPPIRLLLQHGVMLPGYALLETRGRRSGAPRRTPIGNGLVDDSFWIIAEHGEQAQYVRNLRRDPRVRIRLRRGLRFAWLAGRAELRPDDDPWARQRWLARGHPLRALNALVVQLMGTEPLTIRVTFGADPGPDAECVAPRLGQSVTIAAGAARERTTAICGKPGSG